MRRFLAVRLLTCAGSCICLAQSTKLVDCPGDRVYRDNRNGVGGQVYCEHVLPGSLAVKDGPFRFWFNPDFEGSSGKYNEGREVGKWKECDRFGRCEQKDYPAIYPEEKARPGFKPEIPVKYIDGKYVFDFASCRSTWVTHQDGAKADLELNIGAQNDGCFIAHIPADAEGHEGNTDYTCKIPFQTGTRVFSTLAAFGRSQVQDFHLRHKYMTKKNRYPLLGDSPLVWLVRTNPGKCSSSRGVDV